MKIAFLTLYNHYAHGARCLAAYLERAGHEASLINFKKFLSGPVDRSDPAERERIEASGHLPVFESHPLFDMACPYPTPITPAEHDLLMSSIERLRPDVIGFSLTSSHLPLAQQLSREFRERFPKMLQVWGGICPTMDPLGSLHYADAVCVGEGEQSLLEYLEDPTRTDIPNFYFRDGNGGHIANPLRPLIQNLDELPYPMYGNEILIEDGRVLGFSDLDNDHIADMIILTSQRGCPFRCTYCLHSAVHDMYSGQKYLRRKTVDRFLDEIEDRIRRFPMFDTLNLWDDIFMMTPHWIDEFCDKYPSRIGRPFGGYGHPSTTTRPMLERLKKAGAAHIVIGIQSASQYIARDIYHRHIETERFIRFGQDIAEVGFDRIAYELLSRCPFEREEDLRETALLLAHMPKAVKINVKHLVFFPFTRINETQAPRVNVPTKIYHFYEMLYLLAAMPGFDPKFLETLVDDPVLREHPEVIEHWVQQAARLADEKAYAEARLAEAERQMPWGIRRATNHLAGQVRDKLRRTLNNN